MFRLIGKFLFILAVSTFGGTVISGVVIALLQGVNLFGVRMHGSALTTAAVLIFILAFSAIAIPLMANLMKNVSLPTRSRRQVSPEEPETDGSKVTFEELSKTPRRPLIDADRETRTNSETDEMAEFRAAAAETTVTEEQSPGDDDGHEAVEDEDLVDPYAAQPDTPPVTLAPHLMRLKEFMSKSIAQMGGAKPTISKFEKFGICLFVAGVAEGISESNGLDEKACDRLIAVGLKGVGYKQEDAERFAETYQNYLVQSAGYMQMFQTGRNAVRVYQTDATSGLNALQDALENWKKPPETEEKSRLVTVLFTDIAGSTAMTQALGDEGAQRVVRGHNEIVRGALSRWSGREVKHTGDGIMAAFDATSNGVEAAIQMQRDCASYRERNPDLPLHLKIGLNTGEPISEDNDLFGSTVQMSARIVDKAQADEIYVSEAVRGICAGKLYRFENKGPFPMKGFDENPILYEVIWNDPPASHPE